MFKKPRPLTTAEIVAKDHAHAEAELLYAQRQAEYWRGQVDTLTKTVARLEAHPTFGQAAAHGVNPTRAWSHGFTPAHSADREEAAVRAGALPNY